MERFGQGRGDEMETRLVIAAFQTEGYSFLPEILLSPTKSIYLNRRAANC